MSVAELGRQRAASAHTLCIRRLEALLLEGPVRVRPFDGLRWQPVLDLLPNVPLGRRYCVRERSLPEASGIKPDLQVRSVEGDILLAVVEVCSTHPVGPRKAYVYTCLGVPCVEIDASYGVGRDGVLNVHTMWGPTAPPPAQQGDLAERWMRRSRPF